MITLPDGTQVPALPGAEEQTVGLGHVDGRLRASSLTRLAALVNAQPDASLAVLRRWLAPED
jgi:hypothetical protein